MLVLVVEPTLSGIHDMERLVDLAAHFRVPGMVVVNKYDLNHEMTQRIEAGARERNMHLLGRIPFDALFVKAMVQGKSVLEYDPDAEVSREIVRIWQTIGESSVMNPLGIKDFSKAITT